MGCCPRASSILKSLNSWYRGDVSRPYPLLYMETWYGASSITLIIRKIRCLLRDRGGMIKDDIKFTLYASREANQILHSGVWIV